MSVEYYDRRAQRLCGLRADKEGGIDINAPKSPITATTLVDKGPKSNLACGRSWEEVEQRVYRVSCK